MHNLQRRLSPLKSQEVQKQVIDLLQKGLIQPSSSPYIRHIWCANPLCAEKGWFVAYGD